MEEVGTMVTKHLGELVAVAVTAALMWATAKVGAWIRARGKKTATAVPRAIEAVHEIYSAMNFLLSNTAASRVVLLRATNGGKIARVGMDLFSSVAYEVRDKHLESVRAAWQNQRLDEEYVRLLRGVYHEGSVALVTEDMKPSILRDEYEGGGVVASYVVGVASVPEAYFYLSINFAKEPRGGFNFDSAGFRNRVRVAVTKIATALATSHADIELDEGGVEARGERDGDGAS